MSALDQYLHRLTVQFTEMLRKRQVEQLRPWLDAAQALQYCLHHTRADHYLRRQLKRCAHEQRPRLCNANVAVNRI